jgi:bifunctional DNase/RNase
MAANQQCQACGKDVTFHLTLVRRRSCVDERHVCDDHARHLLESDSGARWGASHPWHAAYESHAVRPYRHAGMVVVDVDKIIISESGDQHVIFLREVEGPRSFPWVLGFFEVSGIHRRIQGKTSPRPLTHDLLAAAIAALGGRMQDAVIHELVNHTYRAKVRISQGDRLIEIPYRVSDAVHLAILQRTPIAVDHTVFDEVAQAPDPPPTPPARPAVGLGWILSLFGSLVKRRG